jgi:hypothetical protein
LFCNDRGDATTDGRLLDFKYSTSSDMSTTFLFGRLCVGARAGDMSHSARPPAASTITDDMSAPKSSVIDGRPGYVFRHGVDGLGYYPDANSNPNPNPNEQGSPIVQAPPASEVQVQMPPAVDTPHLASNNHSLTKSRALACAPGWVGRALVRFPGPLFVGKA